jgi:hypothetical protein
MRCPRKLKLTLATRAWAMVTLIVWLGAWAFCSADCLMGDSRCQPEHHHDEQAATSHHDHDQTPDSDKHDCPDSSVCSSLKTFVPSAGNSFIFKHDFSLAYILGAAPLFQALVIPQFEIPIFRQAWRRDWVFTPEVYLGPAFRSHAPPFSSLV